MKKLKIFQITIVVLFIIFIFFFLRATDYTKEYQVNDINIKESYDKKKESYYFTFEYNDIILDYLYESNYKQKRNFINDIEIIEEDDNFCLIPKGDTLEFIPLCYNNKENTYYKNVSDNLKEQIPEEYLKTEKELKETYEDIKIYNKDYTYLLWDYDGFYYINEKENKKIDLFNKEIYNVNLITYTKDYLIIPDYDTDYTFDKFYRISLKDGDVKDYKLKEKIYFDSYYPGYEKNKLYIVDNKEELMYELNVKNGKIEKIKPQILNNNKWEEVGIKTLVNQDKEFKYKTNYNYVLKENDLYLNYNEHDIKTRIDSDVTSIVRIKNNLIFYLKKDTLYVFDPLTGSKKLLNYFEWNFNYKNMIYVD